MLPAGAGAVLLPAEVPFPAPPVGEAILDVTEATAEEAEPIALEMIDEGTAIAELALAVA